MEFELANKEDNVRNVFLNFSRIFVKLHLDILKRVVIFSRDLEIIE